MQIGDRVRIRPSEASPFTIIDTTEDDRFLIEAVDYVPGRYPFSMKPEDLAPAEVAVAQYSRGPTVSFPGGTARTGPRCPVGIRRYRKTLVRSTLTRVFLGRADRI
ncbi:hypothetical protein [Rhodococcus sp. ACT016]|uniref:hypothetical protein n=1 Tax=Rhodococcus sp. ACT016 TaxID=3134808 RepID=UPI003D2CCF2D